MGKSYYYRIRYRFQRRDRSTDTGVYCKHIILETDTLAVFMCHFKQWEYGHRAKGERVHVLSVSRGLKLKQWEAPDFSNAEEICVATKRRSQK